MNRDQLQQAESKSLQSGGKERWKNVQGQVIVRCTQDRRTGKMWVGRKDKKENSGGDQEVPITLITTSLQTEGDNSVGDQMPETLKRLKVRNKKVTDNRGALYRGGRPGGKDKRKTV